MKKETERKIDENYSIVAVKDCIEGVQYYAVTFRGNILERYKYNILNRIPGDVVDMSIERIDRHKQWISKFIDKLKKLRYVNININNSTIETELFSLTNIYNFGVSINNKYIIDKEWSDYFAYKIEIKKHLFSKNEELKTYYSILNTDEISYIVEELKIEIDKQKELELKNEEQCKEKLLEKIGMTKEQVESLMELLSMNVKISNLK